MVRTALLTAVVACVAAVPIASQQVTIVQTGQTFPDIPPALAVAPVGATLFVDPGTYSPFTVTQGVSIHSSNGTTYSVMPSQSGQPSIEVVGIPGSQDVVITGARITDWFGLDEAIEVRACTGDVLLVNVRVAIPSGPTIVSSVPSVVRIDSSALAYFERVVARGPAGTPGVFGTAAVDGCQVVGCFDIVLNRCDFRGFDNPEGAAGHGIFVDVTTNTWIDRTIADGATGTPGGDGVRGRGSPTIPTTVRRCPTPPASLWTGGPVGGLPVRLLPNATLVDCIADTPTLRPVPLTESVSITQMTLRLDLTSTTARSYTLYLGYAPRLTPGLGNPLVDGLPTILDFFAPLAPSPLCSGSIAAGGTVTFTFAVPNDPTLIGGTIFFQTAVTSTGPQGYTWSEPTVIYIRQ